MAPPVLANSHRCRTARKVIKKENGGWKPQHLCRTPLCFDGADRHSLPPPARAPRPDHHSSSSAHAPLSGAERYLSADSAPLALSAQSVPEVSRRSRAVPRCVTVAPRCSVPGSSPRRERFDEDEC
ncbi:hypothetical protein NDU88_009561 [Pleurodeles waltl]|uniref:Uncharacterized protein n=1 Tax=Pleurodeles waltl TaxID=8319 RepID=A0AAV7P6Z0_PLEWA|nr:hypothetical protein NDU88_009561 [Pleurodeles waltl]